MKTICLDIGNTTAHVALFEHGEMIHQTRVMTPAISISLPKILEDFAPADHLAYCSVVPKFNVMVEEIAQSKNLQIFNLNSKTCPIPIDYPKPEEIGQDRLANAIGACALTALPAVVIDMGTATTFDIISLGRGYIGGVIAPGLSLMCDYLHEKTALLPEIHYWKAPWPESCIGKSTKQAMEIGGVVGYTGMIKEILTNITRSLQEQGIDNAAPSLLLTGGKAPFIEQALGVDCKNHPCLTLLGLEIACARSLDPNGP
jgi:type III pantothenate kinase